MDGHTCAVDTDALEYTLYNKSHGFKEAIHVTHSASYDSIMVGGLLPRRRSIHMVPFNHGGVDINNIPKNIRQGADIGIVIDIEQYARDGHEVFVSPSGMLLSNRPIPSKYFKLVFALASKKTIHRKVRFMDTVECREFDSCAEASVANVKEQKILIIKCRFCGAKEFQGAVLCLSCSGNLGGEDVDMKAIAQQIADESGKGGQRLIDRGQRKPATPTKEWWKMSEREFARYGRQLEKRAKSVMVDGRRFEGLLDRYDYDDKFQHDMNGMQIYSKEIRWLAEAAKADVEHTGRSQWQRQQAATWVPTVWTSDGDAMNPITYDHERAEELYREQASKKTESRGKPMAWRSHDYDSQSTWWHSDGGRRARDRQEWTTSFKLPRTDRDDWSSWDYTQWGKSSSEGRWHQYADSHSSSWRGDMRGT